MQNIENENVISIRGLKMSYGKVEVLKGIDLDVKRGTMLALLGPNGAGKTTMVRILSTLLKPDSGTAVIAGYDVVKEADGVRANIGLTGQYAAVDEYLTGRDNLNMMGRLYHLSKVDTKRRTEELLKEFDLIDAADRPAKTYSGGMRRRLDLAVSLIATPPILFLDEPTTGLDPRSRLKIWEIVERLLKEGTTILLTTQYLDEADKLADKIVVLDHGTIIASGTANELKDKVGKERLEIVLKSKNDFNKAKGAIGNDVAFSKDEEMLLSVTTGGSVAELKKILDKMEANGVEVESFSLHKPTLDDVFLKLTGVGAVEDNKIEEK